ncbi:type I polyketide synthase [Archangium violaceum]|uniref:type I polyketide synthase n=1 Tax=Archangium violaceum TaxID=83451 RepID=UPI002B319AB1|nr:type I polyketide synthase [Archangium violaceum]
MSDMLKQLARMIRELPPDRRAFLAELLRPEPEPIAIVGAGCRFPAEADSPEAFWNLLEQGVDAISEVPPERWDLKAFHDPDPEAKGKGNTRWGGFLRRVDEFDPGFFGITPREAIQMDPQQRLLIEVAYESLEDAGIPIERISGTQAGVFVGISGGDYNLLQLASPEQIDAYTCTGAVRSIIANRLSYLFDLRGPSLVIDTACSSSLVAVHLACQSLRNKECDLAIAGGANLVLSPHWSVAIAKLQALSSDGRCKTFDARADGFVRAEGFGTVVLKRLSDALAAGDRIRALIRGSATNQDGHSQGLTAPNGLTQQALLRQALQNGGVKPEQVDFIETHGTGTSLGDPIEVSALSEVYGKPRPDGRPCVLGAVKTNVGHLEAAAGIAGLLKVMLALEHGAIPKQLHFQQLNPNISLKGTRFVIPTEMRPWPSEGPQRRMGAVSSFGIGGANAHMVLEEAPPPEPKPASTLARPRHLLALSAKTGEALRALADRYAHHLSTVSEEAVADVCHTAHLGRSHFKYRLAVEGASGAELRERLARFAAGEEDAVSALGTVEEDAPREVAFLFTGQGSQYADMGRALYRTQPVFREVIDRCSALLGANPVSLLSVLYPEPGAPSRIDETAFTQPALFALQCALVELWRSWGIEPSIVMGHSVGEYSAAYVAGVFSLEDGLRLIAARGRLMQALPPGGAMTAIFANEARVSAAVEPLKGRVSIAAINGPTEVVISGEKAAVEEIAERFHTEGVETRRLNVSHAFHSPLMEPVLSGFTRVAAGVTYKAPKVKLISNLTGQLMLEAPTAESWSRHLREPVRFLESLRTLGTLGCRTIIEIGPTPTLIGMGRRCLPDEGLTWLPSLRKGKDDWQQMLSSLGALYVRGLPVHWAGFDKAYACRRVSAPTYPFQRKRYWLADSSPERPVARASSSAPLASPDGLGGLYRLEWKLESHAHLKEGSRGDVERDGGTWLLLSDRGGVGTALAERLRARGARCVLVVPGDGPLRREEGVWKIDPSRVDDFTQLLEEGANDEVRPLRGIVHLWSLDIGHGGASSLLASQMLGCGSALHLVQALARFAREGRSPRVWWVTRGVHTPGVENGPVEAAQAPLWGLGRVLALEHPELWGGLVDLSPQFDETELESLLREFSSPGGDDQIALRGASRSVMQLAPCELPASSGETRIRSDGAYLITGGLGGIGLRVARWMVEQGARHLVLVGRRGASEAQQAVIEEMERAGARVLVVQGDISKKETLAGLLERARQAIPPLRGVIHAAGVLDDGVLLRQDWQRFERVMAPKMEGAWNLHELTRELDLDFFILFSSMASVLGSRGQGNYAAANAFLDALARMRRALGLPAASIQWGPWAQVGMAASQEARGLRVWSEQGVGPIEPEEGLRLLDRAIRMGGTTAPAEVCVLPVNWPVFLEQLAAERTPRWLTEIARKVRGDEGTTRAAQPRLLERLAAAPPLERRSVLSAHIAGEVARIMGFDSSQTLNPREGFFAMGMDSLMAVELKSRLQTELGQTLSSSCVFNYPTLESLTGYLARTVTTLEMPEDTPGASQPTTTKDDASALAPKVDALSGSALAELFDEQLSAIDALIDNT